MLFMILGVKIEEHCSTENKPAMEKNCIRKLPET
jgi:hypothetical protein